MAMQPEITPTVTAINCAISFTPKLTTVAIKEVSIFFKPAASSSDRNNDRIPISLIRLSIGKFALRIARARNQMNELFFYMAGIEKPSVKAGFDGIER
jgi:hypothetical protein